VEGNRTTDAWGSSTPPGDEAPPDEAPRSGEAMWAPAGAPPTPTGPPAPPARPRRRWPLVVGLVLALVLAAAGGGVAWQQRNVAAEWRDRADVMELARDDARGRAEALQRQLDEVSEVLAVSESDVSQLEQRIRELADEKAQAEDTATTVQVERDVFVQLSTTVAGAVEALDVCVTQLFSLLEDSVQAFNDAAAGLPVDVVPLNASKDATTDFCNEARSAAAGAGAAADQLLR
jgi:DNA-binding transcriptional regulator YdaS (Cro superfamily)